MDSHGLNDNRTVTFGRATRNQALDPRLWALNQRPLRAQASTTLRPIMPTTRPRMSPVIFWSRPGHMNTGATKTRGIDALKGKSGVHDKTPTTTRLEEIVSNKSPGTKRGSARNSANFAARRQPSRPQERDSAIRQHPCRRQHPAHIGAGIQRNPALFEPRRWQRRVPMRNPQPIATRHVEEIRMPPQ